MPTLLFKDFGLVKGVRFDSWRRVGSVMQAVKVYNMREVDELVFLDITATPEGREPDFETVDELADDCFMPLTVGGGVRRSRTSGACSRSGPTRSRSTRRGRDPELIHGRRRRSAPSASWSRSTLGRPGGGCDRHALGDRRRPADPAELARATEDRGPARSS